LKSNTIIIDSYKNLAEVREYIVQYLPEGVYYDRNLYADLKKCHPCKKERKKCRWCNNLTGQELAFDIDPENVSCPYHGDLGRKMKSGPGLGFCMYEFNVVRRQTLKLYEELSERFTKMKVVYSGRGFHIHIFDEDATRMDFEERKKLAEGLDYAIDEWVTSGEMRLIRLPYSLHGMVSRICSPLDIEKTKYFDPRNECIPAYLRKLR
jgi:DNA primase catalytic subunit